MKAMYTWKLLIMALMGAFLIIAVKHAWNSEWFDTAGSIIAAGALAMFWPSTSESHNATPAQHENATDAEKSNETDS